MDPDSDLIIKDYSEVRLFLGNLSFRDQVIAMCMLSSGQDPGDVLNLEIGFIMRQSSRSRIIWEGQRIKTGEEFRTFFSAEATKWLRRYIAQERQGAEVSEKVFMRKGDVPLTPSTLSDIYREASKRMGLTNGRTQHPYRPKRFRSIFSSACYQAKIDDNARHTFMGHPGTISEKYRNMPPQNLEQIYRIVEPYLTIFSEDKNGELKALKDKTNETNGMVVSLVKENAELKQALAELSGSFRARCLVPLFGF